MEAHYGKAKAAREFGTLVNGKPYFFIKPFNQSGWLFERTDEGWAISKADKIYSQDSFVRSGHAWDVASVLSNEKRDATPRVNSSRFQLNLVSLSLYEEKIRNHLLEPLIEQKS